MRSSSLHEEKQPNWLPPAVSCWECCSLSLGVGKSYTIFGLNLFDLFDFVTAKIMLPLGGFFISIFTGWYLDKKIVWEEVSNNGTLNIHIYRLLIFILKYIAPIGIGLIFINELGFFK